MGIQEAIETALPTTNEPVNVVMLSNPDDPSQLVVSVLAPEGTTVTNADGLDVIADERGYPTSVVLPTLGDLLPKINQSLGNYERSKEWKIRCSSFLNWFGAVPEIRQEAIVLPLYHALDRISPQI